MRRKENQRLVYSRRWFFFALLTVSILSIGSAIPPSIDLVIVKFQSSPERVFDNTKVEMAVTVQNRRSNPAYDVNVELILEKNGQIFRIFRDVPLLSVVPQNGTASSIPISVGVLSDGTYTIKAFVDPYNNIPETDENNNRYFQQLTVFKT